ncbi:MAG: ATP-binding protein [Acidimicrobiales bacterium]
MGKTRLAEELAAGLARSAGALVVRGRCVPYGEANVWWPVAEVLRQLFELDIDTSLDLATEIIRRNLTEHGDALAGNLDRFTTAALHALGYPNPLRNGNRDRNRAEVTLMLTSLLEVELARRPVVMLLSDMHWAAEAVWSLVSHVLSQLARTRFVVVLTARRTGEELRNIEGGSAGSPSNSARSRRLQRGDSSPNSTWRCRRPTSTS